MADISKHLIIKGRVQGVGFRYWLSKTAQESDVSGWVRNLDNGDVEAMLHGAEGNVEHVLLETYNGPLPAVVNEIIVEDKEPSLIEGFEIRETA